MKVEQRTGSRFNSSGPYLAEIANNLDPTRMGLLEVVLRKSQAIPDDLQSLTHPVRYLSPFYGVTSIKFEGNNSSDFNDVQKSYGMWMVPPDIGTTVLVIFIEGDPNQGYWIGCVSDEFQNNMVPGIAASLASNMTQEQIRKYGTTNVPVAEIHRGSQTLNVLKDPSRIPKAVHPFADRLLAQGLLLDTARGITSSSSRREIPSMVFGISTPGPVDPDGKKGKLGYTGNRQFPVSRLGGTTFVMDDGDQDGENELVRIRTRTGHQILLHNSQDLIYIANSRGTAWIEMTSDGKIDIYAKDSVSIRTEADFNFRADRDINLEALRNLNVSVGNSVNVNVETDFTLIVNKEGKLSFNNLGIIAKTDLKLKAESDMHVRVNDSFYHTTTNSNNIIAGKNNNFSANANTNIVSVGSHLETANQIHMNGPTAAQATAATTPEDPIKLKIYKLPNRDKTVGWSNGKFYVTDDLLSIMQRAPTHEPWPQHENYDKEKFSSTNTDILTGSANS